MIALPSVEVVTPAAKLPVSYPECKDHLRLDDDYDRDLVVGLIEAATAHAEGELQRSLVARTLRATAADPARYMDLCVPLPLGPVLSVVSVNGDDGANGVEVVRHGTAHLARFPADSPYLGDEVRITYRAGYGEGAADVPADLRLAIRQHVTDLYQLRGATTDRPRTALANAMARIYARNRAGGQIA